MVRKFLETPESKKAQDTLYNLIVNQNEITWQSIIYEMIHTGQINPWDVDISLLTHNYIQITKKVKKADFRISGKVLLAAALLLKLKSIRLVGKDIEELDRLFSSDEESMDSLFYEEEQQPTASEDIPSLIPRTPQPRKRKLSVYDLMNALEKALEVKERRLKKYIPLHNFEYAPKHRFDVGKSITKIYTAIKHFFVSTPSAILTFTSLLPSQKREDKIYTFIPLLHLATERKIDLEQQEPFGEIEIKLAEPKEIPEEDTS